MNNVLTKSDCLFKKRMNTIRCCSLPEGQFQYNQKYRTDAEVNYYQERETVVNVLKLRKANMERNSEPVFSLARIKNLNSRVPPPPSNT